MFVLAILQDKLKIAPKDFGKDPTQALINAVEIKYSNKVLQNVGLGVCFYDFLKVEEGMVYPGEGAAHYLCRFRFAFFRPFVGEVLEGIIEESNSEGLRISIRFFDDIFVPRECLMGDAKYSVEMGEYYAHELVPDEVSDRQSDGDTNTSSAASLEDVYWYRNKNKVRFKVREIEFNLNKDTAKGLQTITTTEDRSTSLVKLEVQETGDGREVKPTVKVKIDDRSSGDGAASSNGGSTRAGVTGGALGAMSSLDEPGFVPRRRSSSITKEVATVEGSKGETQKVYTRPACLKIVGTMAEYGLGDVAWWADE